MQTAHTHAASAATSVSIQLPSTPQSGDLLLAAVAFQDSHTTLNTPAGWSWVNMAGTGSIGQAILYHVVTAGETNNYTFTINPSSGTGEPVSVFVQEVTGQSTTNPVAGSGETDAGSGFAMASSTLTANGALPVAFFAQYAGGQVPGGFGATPAWTGRYTVEFSSGYMTAQESVYGPLASGAVNVTESWSGGSNASSTAELVLVNPAVVNGPAQPAPTVAPTIAPTPPPTGASHVHQMLYFGGNYINMGIPAAYIAAHADFINDDPDPRYANAFIAAGGKYAVVYTDPHLVPYCSTPGPGAPGTCAGPLGPTTPESAWLHDSTNTRLHVSPNQDALDPASPATQSAYSAYTASLTNGTSFNAVFMDDTQPGYDSNYFSYKFGAQAQEIVSQSNPNAFWLAGQQALAASASKPVLYNGGDGDVNDLALAASANVLGSVLEGCVVNQSNRVNDTQGNPAYLWAPSLNKLIGTQNLGRYAICLNYNVSGGDVIGDRLYALASWWLAYDPNWSVAFPDFQTPNTAGGQPSMTYAEYDIVPTQPLTSPGTNVNNLRASSGAYVREFAACFQGGSYIGKCATIVNPSYSNTVTAPALTNTYTRTLTLNNESEYNGGTATWTSGGVPSTLAPESGLILLQ